MLAINQFARKFFQKYSQQIEKVQATLLWQESIAPHLKKITHAKKIKKNKIYILVKEQQWLFPLLENKQDLINKFNQKIIEKSLSITITEIDFRYDAEFNWQGEKQNLLKNFLQKRKSAIQNLEENLAKKNLVKKNLEKSLVKKKIKIENNNNQTKIKQQIEELKTYYAFYFNWQKKYNLEIGTLENQQETEIPVYKNYYTDFPIDSFFLKNNDGIDYFEFNNLEN